MVAALEPKSLEDSRRKETVLFLLVMARDTDPVAVDIWILEVQNRQQAAHGLSKAFGIDSAGGHQIVNALPFRVKQNVAEEDAPRWKKKLAAIGAKASWGPAGASSPPPPIVEVPPNEPPAPSVEIPEAPLPFGSGGTRTAVGVLMVGVATLLGVRVFSPAMSSGEAGWVGVAAFAIGLALCGVGVVQLVLAAVFHLDRPSPLAYALPIVIALAIPVSAKLLNEPDPRERLVRVASLRSEILGGQVPEARSFLAGGGIFATSNASSSASLVESLYSSGARRVFAVDENGDGEAEWVGVDMPVLPERRGAIASAVRSYAGSDFSSIPPELSAPSGAQHWIFPVDVH